MQQPPIQTLRCPRCGDRDADEFRHVADDVPPGALLEQQPPPVTVLRHRKCGRFVWIPCGRVRVAAT